MNNIPNLFIVGAAKAGTTSLYHYLKQHPEVFMSEYKEPIFYSNNSFIKTKEEYYQLFTNAPKNCKVIGEASTNYLAAPESAQNIYNEHPSAKIIIILRNPIKRAFSLYKWMARAGFEKAANFKVALKFEPKRLGNEQLKLSPVYYNYLYFNSGLYSDQITRYLNLFGENNCKIILFEEFIKNEKNSFKKICQFLNIDPSYTPEFKTFNKGKFPLSVRLQHFLRNDLAQHIGKLNGKKGMYDHFLVNLLAGINSNLGKEPNLDPKIKKKLLEDYHNDIIRLEKIINKDLSNWLR